MEIVDGEVLLYDPNRTQAIYLNSTAALIWGLCDGSRSLRDIAQLIETGYADSGVDVLKEISITLKRLQEYGVVVLD